MPAQQSNNTVNNQSLISAPLNPQFVKYQESLNNTVRSNSIVLSKSSALSDSDAEFLTGYIPGPVDLSYLKGEQITPDSGIHAEFQALSAYPDSYDLRSLGKVTPVEDQGTSGCCWAFATYASLESYLLPGETWDFSENNLKNTAGFDLNPNSGGGNEFMSTAYLVRWSGPVASQDDPYNPSSVSSPTDLPVQQHVQNVLFIPGRNNSTDNNNIKWVLENYGAVYTTIYATGGIVGYYTDSYFNASTNSYYYTINDSGSNHAVAIVGWDDNYSRNNFSTPPPGNGAFIVKNSWGTDWGDNGYFYVSYYDTCIGSDNAVFTSEPTSDYDNIYQYDPLGWTTSMGFTNISSAWFANVFVANANQQLTSVGFYTPQINSQYTIYIYNGSINNKILLESQSGSIQVPGYYTIPLNSDILLKVGQSFCIEVDLSTPGYDYPISIEAPISDYSGNATANASESWVSTDGQSWTDITKIYTNTNVCLKAYTNDIVGIDPESLNITEGCTGNYSIVLRSQPGSNVMVNILNDSLVNVNRSSVVFSLSNWSIPQYVAVTAVGDYMIGDNMTDVITHSVSSSDPYYNEAPVDNLTINLANNSVASQPYLLFNSTAYFVNENAGTVEVNVTRLVNTSLSASVNYTTGGGNATVSNYKNTSGILYFPPGSTNETITVPVIDDGIFDTQKCFNIILSNASNVSLGATTTTVYINNTDPTPSFNFSAPSYNANWSDNNATITITKTGQTAIPSSVNYFTTNGNASAGVDYAATNGTITFQPADMSESFNVSLLHDHGATGNTSFNVTLSSAKNATISTSGTADVEIILLNPPPPLADFASNVTSGSAPLVVQFNDTSIGNNITSRQWNFGDGSDNSTVPDPVHIFGNNSSSDAGYNVTLTVTNEAGSSTKQVMNYITVDPESTFTISLVSGWNLISVPLNISNNDIEQFFPADVLDGIVDVWGWNETTQNWMYFSPDPVAWFADNYPNITSIETGKAYWVEMNKSASFTITGTIPSTAPASPVQLGSSWNFVGPTGLTSSTPEALYPSNVVDVWGWNETTQNWVYYSPDPVAWFEDNYPELTSIEPGHGYWVELPG
jgi:C1A family cysteine protease/PKD repeat protein